jgi:hypothetical protein
MSKSKQKKLALFKLFSQNLEWVKEHPSISFKPDFSKGYICPLCFEVFYEKDLDTGVANPLTFEDIPPASLGGKPMALTCRQCNSTSGHKLDAHLLNNLLETDAQLFLPNSKSKASFSLRGNKVNGAFQVDDKGTVRLDLMSQRSDPKQANEFMTGLFPPKTSYSPLFHPDKLFDEYRSPTFNIQFKISSDERRAEIALLRIAYLIAYATLGNGFLINGGLYKVREQILHPDKDVLPKAFWIKYDFEKEQEGINIIALPKELHCFLVIFSLTTKSRSRRFAVALPGPSSPGLEVYDFITDKLCVGDGTQLTHGMIERMDSKDYLHKKDYAFASHHFWNQCTKADYKPRLRPEA